MAVTKVLVAVAAACGFATFAGAQQCKTSCTDVNGKSVLTIKAKDLVLQDADPNADVLLMKGTLDKNEDDFQKKKGYMEQLIADLSTDYETELKEVDDAMRDTYGTFLDNYEDVFEKDREERGRLTKQLGVVQSCQSQHKVYRSLESESARGGWDQGYAPEIAGNGAILGNIARTETTHDSFTSECLPALIASCDPGQLTSEPAGRALSPSTGEVRKVFRHLKDPECPAFAGSTCTTSCPDAYPGDEIRNTCGADGNWVSELSSFSRVKVFTTLDEADVEAWASYRGGTVDSTFFGQDASNVWPKHLDLQNVDFEYVSTAGTEIIKKSATVNLQSYLNFRGINCNVLNTYFEDGFEEDETRIGFHLSGASFGQTVFIDQNRNAIASVADPESTSTNVLHGSDYVEIPSALCKSEVRKTAGEQGMAYYQPGQYDYEDAAGIQRSTVINCDGSSAYDGDFRLEAPSMYVAGSGQPALFSSLNQDSHYTADDGWYFRPMNRQPGISTQGKEWEFLQWGHDDGGTFDEIGALAPGWNLPTIGDDGMHGKVHGPFGSSQMTLQKEFNVPRGAELCKFTFKNWQGGSWDNEHSYFRFKQITSAQSGAAGDWQQLHSQQGNQQCSDYGRSEAQAQNDEFAGVALNAYSLCYTDVEVSVQCSEGYIGVEFDSDLDSPKEDEFWAVSDFTLEVTGNLNAGPMVMQIHHFEKSMKWATSVSPQGSPFFVWSKKVAWQPPTGHCDEDYNTMVYAESARLYHRCDTSIENCLPIFEKGKTCNSGANTITHLADMKCASNTAKVSFGYLDTLAECAQVCRESSGCSYFTYADNNYEGYTYEDNNGADTQVSGNCMMEIVSDDKCGTGGLEQTSIGGTQPGTWHLYKLMAEVSNRRQRQRRQTSTRLVSFYKKPVVYPDLDDRVSLEGIVAWWKMEDFDADAWQWESAVPHYETGEKWAVDFVEKGDLSVQYGGEGAHPRYAALHGNTDQGTKISWGNVVSTQATLCTTSKYEPGGKLGRVFRGGKSNWIHGHWNGYSRAVQYDEWNVYPLQSPAGRFNDTDWVVTCSTTQGAATVFVNKFGAGIEAQNAAAVDPDRWGQKELIVGACGRKNCGQGGGEDSGFRVSEVIAWNRGMSRDELKLMTQYLLERLEGKAE